LADEDEVQRAWGEAQARPEAVLERLPEIIDRAMPGELGRIARLIVYVAAIRLGRFADGFRLTTRLQEHGRVSTDGGSIPSEGEAVDRAHAVFLLLTGDLAGFEGVLGQLGFRRPSQEAQVLAAAATAMGLHASSSQAGEWLMRAASLSFGVADTDPAVRAVAEAGETLADALLASLSRMDPQNSLLRTSSMFARIAWERSGSWREVQLAEYRQAVTHLVLGEPLGAVAHAEACLAVCESHAAGADELVFAWEAVARARHAAGDHDGSRVARDRAFDCVPRLSAAVRERAERVLGTLPR
jgi:hypothetical protein